MKEFEIKLDEKRLNLVLAALTELPWKDVNDTIQYILQQVNKPPTEAIQEG